MSSLSAALLRAGEKTPHAPALTPLEGPALTHGDLLHRSARYGHALLARGFGHGDRIAVLSEKTPEFICLYLAVLRLGGIFVPLNPSYTAPELSYILGDLDPKGVVCSPSLSPNLSELAIPVISLKTLGEESEGYGVDFSFDGAGDGDDPCAIIYTSGTTGRPKGAILTSKNLLSNAEALSQLWRFSSEDTLLHALPLFHVHGLFIAMHLALLSGAHTLFLPKFSATSVLSLLPRATVFMGVPTFYHRLLEATDPELTADLARSVRVFISGSAPLSPQVFKAFEERTGHRILERYGMSETIILTSNPYPQEKRRPGTVGFPLPGVCMRVVDLEMGQVLGPGEEGLLEVCGPNVFSGYWKRGRGDDFSKDGFFKTSDLGTLDGEGYVRILGRKKELIITGGLNVYPKEVELVLEQCPGVLECAVLGRPHRDFGEEVIAVVTLREGMVFDPGQARILLSEKLAPFKHPKAFFITDTLPKNALGKIQKGVLRERYSAAPPPP